MENCSQNFSFWKIKRKRIKFLNDNKLNDHAIVFGKNKVLLSAPHGVNQVRLGKLKYMEPGSLALALCLQKLTDSFLIAKTQNNNDDANFDAVSNYRDDIDNLILQKDILYVLDFHGLASSRPIDVNLGINMGRNIENNTQAFDMLFSLLKSNNFNVSIDQPFSGSLKTIAGSTKNKHKNIFTLQIEINSRITSLPQNNDKFNSLLKVLAQWINLLEVKNEAKK